MEDDDVQSQQLSNEGGPAAEPEAPAEAPKSVAAMLEAAKQEAARQDAARLEAATRAASSEAASKQETKPEGKAESARPEGGRGRQGGAPGQGRGEGPSRGPGGPGTGRGGQRSESRPPGGGERREGGRPGGEHRGPGGGERREGGRPGGARPFDGMGEIELEKLVSDSLYLDNQAHAVVARMRDMDSGTKSQLRRLYNAVRRAVRAPESERQHQFVMLRARLAYTIARHSLRSLDALERLLLQVTRRNDARGYERFKDLFEAIVAYNE
jgi:CRISPR type III-A-associated protein Csm2